jgi:hypothetical protein
MPLRSLPAILARPERIVEVNGDGWNTIILQARRTQVLGQLAARLAAASVMDKVPEPVVRHLTLARLTSRRRAEAASWEISVIRRAVALDTPIMLLKGCAYLAARDANADGRLFSDIDLLVPRVELGKTEAALTGAGWMPGKVNDYDRHYYRDWSHEVPPMEHVRRHTVVDLHHAIIPPISRYCFPTEKLFQSTEEILPGVYVPGNADRAIHCAVHVLQEGEASKVFRDLYDLFLLSEQHFPTAELRSNLFFRAESLGLRRVVATALAAADSIFSNSSSPIGTIAWLKRCLVGAALDSAVSGGNAIAGQVDSIALLAYSHWMKMPLPVLLPHLLRKTFTKSSDAQIH